jgi:penicillin-binding protein 1A
LQNAVISIEDARFYYHHGVDFRAVFRAAKENAESGALRQGGSTITQQLVKNTLLDSGKRLDRKIEEASLAWQLEDHYSKQRILEVYLNTVYFGNGAYGVEAATQEYFGHSVRQIDLVQAATIAGLVQAPNDYDPVQHPEAATARRNVVLQKMLEEGYIDGPEHDRAVATPLTLTPAPEQDRYPAAHFVNEVEKFISNDPHFGDTPEERENLLFNGGLRIYTTVDLGLQTAAEQAINDVMPDPNGPAAALVAVDPRTGYVRAMVGGRDYFGPQEAAKCNLAVGCNDNPALNGRGTGSAFKPFVLAAALTEGIPLSEVISAPGCIDLSPPTGPWHVCNADPGEGAPGGTNLVEGTVHSFNTLYAQLVLQVGVDKALAMANKLGLTGHLEQVPAAVLGSNNVTVLDMASAYGTFANRGVHVTPVLVTKVAKADGTVIYENTRQTKKAIDEGVADTVTSVLQQVIARGTGTAAKEDFPVAGKTGTGEDYKNAWFCGYTTSLATAVWAGFPTSEISMHPPATAITVYGGTWPARIWQEFMAVAAGAAPPGDFPIPPPPSSTTTTTLPSTVPTVSDTLAAVPEVRGMSYTDAAQALAGAGFRVARYDIVRAGVAPGAVVAQSPTGGSSAPGGAIVTVEVAQPPDDSITVPDVVGMAQREAVDELHKHGLEAKVVQEPPPKNGPKGRVWKQSPPAGTVVAQGTTVTITIPPE